MPPPQTQFTSLDIFTAAYSPRRFCQAKQKYILSKYSMQLSLSSRFLPATFLKHCSDFNTKSVYAVYTTKNVYILCLSPWRAINCWQKNYISWLCSCTKKKQEIIPSKLPHNFTFFSCFHTSCSFLFFVHLEVNKPFSTSFW